MRIAFVQGHSGEPGKNTLFAMMRTASIPRDEVGVFQVFSSEPQDDAELKRWRGDAGKVQRELARLEAELALAAPSVIVPLGGTSLWAFTGSDAIEAHRGHAALATVVCKGKKIVPTLAASRVEKQWKYFQIVVNDLLKAEREVERGPGVYTPKRRIRIDPRLSDLLKLTKPILAAPVLSLDIETSWGQVTHFGIAWSEEDAVSIPFVDKRSPNNCYFRSEHEEFAVWEWIRYICASPVPKLGQSFGNYDAIYLLGKMGLKVYGYSEDTCLLHHVLYPELEKSLEFLAAAYSEQGAWKHLGRRYSKDEIEKGDG